MWILWTWRRHFILFSSLSGFKCPICSKSVASDEMEMHFIMCLSKPRLSYNGKGGCLAGLLRWLWVWPILGEPLIEGSCTEFSSAYCRNAYMMVRNLLFQGVGSTSQWPRSGPRKAGPGQVHGTVKALGAPSVVCPLPLLFHGF